MVAVLCWIGTASGAVVNVDCNPGDLFVGQGAYADPGNDTWNGVVTAASGALVDSAGNPSDVTVTIGPYSGGLAGNAAPANDLTGDCMYYGSYDPSSITIAGLTAGADYDLYFYALWATGNVTKFTIDGVTKEVGYAGGDYDLYTEGTDYTVFYGVEADGTGEIVAEWDADVGGGALLNGIQIVPEPGTMVLLALAGLAARRRR